MHYISLLVWMGTQFIRQNYRMTKVPKFSKFFTQNFREINLACSSKNNGTCWLFENSNPQMDDFKKIRQEKK